MADKMEEEFRDNSVRPKPSFLLLLGDVVYHYGESQNYFRQFYLPFFSIRLQFSRWLGITTARYRFNLFSKTFLPRAFTEWH